MFLTDYEKAMLDGEHGEVKKMAMAVLYELGLNNNVEKFIDIACCHDDSTVYFGEAQVAFAEHLADMGAKFAVPTSSNACALDMRRWQDQRIPRDWMTATRRIEASHTKMGAAGCWTCTPYQAGFNPRFGEQVAFAESNVIAWTNSVIGARTNRYAGPLELLAGIVGKVPYFGLHITENRKAEGLLVLGDDVKSEMFEDDSIYNLLGFIHGEQAEDRIFAMEGVPQSAKIDCIKQFSATAASSGGIALFHLIGLTPEAQSRDMCFHGEKPKEIITINCDMLREAEAKLCNYEAEGDLDLVSLGCPHFSYAECMALDEKMNGRKVSSNTQMWVFTNRSNYTHIETTGLLDRLKCAGIQIFRDGCTMEYPIKEWGTKNIMTNSGKFANYCYSKTGVHPVFSNVDDCIESAVSGKIIRSKKQWAS